MSVIIANKQKKAGEKSPAKSSDDKPVKRQRKTKTKEEGK